MIPGSQAMIARENWCARNQSMSGDADLATPTSTPVTFLRHVCAGASQAWRRTTGPHSAQPGRAHPGTRRGRARSQYDSRASVQRGVTLIIGTCGSTQPVIALHPSSAPVAISRTRLSPPRIAGVAIHRAALQDRLRRSLTVPLTIVVAPAGHGKTRTLVEWTAQAGCPTAWLSLTPREAELTRFAAHLAAALDQAQPGLASMLYRHLEAPDRLDPGDLGERFADALFDLPGDLVLVLDDFHTADSPAVVAFMTGFILASPARLHTVIASRRQPAFALARLRTQGHVEELNASDFRFSPADTASLLYALAGLQATPELASRIHAAVGGWPAAIRLLAISLDAGGAPDASAALSAGPGAALLLDYLGEEVLSQLALAQRNLLLLAALPERFNAGLLAALAASFATPFTQGDLEALRSLDLFREIPGLDDTWYAYHPLFRDTFLRQLTSEHAATLETLHHAAAGWFAQAGQTREAVWHLVHAGDLTTATTLITARIGAAFGHEDWQAIASWFALIPEDAVRTDPALSLASAWVAFLSGRGGRLVAHLADLDVLDRQGLLSTEHQAQVDILSFGASVAVVRAGRTVADVRERVLPHMDPANRYRYGFAHMMVGLGLSEEGDTDGALRYLEAYTVAESSHVDAAFIRGFFGRVLVLWHAGRLAACAQAAADMRALSVASALPLSAGWAELLLAVVAHERGDSVAATAGYAAVIANADNLHFSCVREAFTRQITAYQIAGQHEEADRALSRLREIVVAIGAPEHLPVCDSLAARLALFRGELAAATSWLATTQAQPERFEALYLENPILTRVLVLLALGQPEHVAEASAILATLRQHTERTHSCLAARDVQALTAYLHDLAGDHSAAASLMRDVLRGGAAELAFHRLAFLPLPLGPLLRRASDAANLSPAARAALESQAARRLAPARPPRIRRAASPHTLTRRELEVLDCLARRLTNDEISAELFISTITARNHVSHVCSKLGVAGRRAAVVAAREQGLIA